MKGVERKSGGEQKAIAQERPQSGRMQWEHANKICNQVKDSSPGNDSARSQQTSETMVCADDGTGAHQGFESKRHA